jgi:hypothetical protein
VFVSLCSKYSPQRIKDEFEQFLKEQTGLLHPSHAVLFNLLLPLVNVAGALRELKLKLDLCRRVVELSERCFPKHFLPLCNYYETLAVAHTNIVRQGAKDKSVTMEKHNPDTCLLVVFI